MFDTLTIALMVGGGVAAAFAGAWLARRIWLRRVRRSLVMLFGWKEAIVSAVRSLRELMERLAGGTEETWIDFVEDSESDERRAVGDLAHRMDVVTVELGAAPLPSVLHGLADRLEDLARQVRDAAVRIDMAPTPKSVIDALERIELASIVERLEAAERELAGLQQTYGVTDPAVYGGGMYI